jgi:hypothetical protein
VLFFILFSLFLGLQYLPVYTSKAEIDRLFKPITTEYGINIVYEIGEDFFSPLKNPPIPAGPWRHSKVKPMNARALSRYPRILHEAFEKYPAHIIKKHLKGVHFAGMIDEDGFKYAGSYDPFRRIIYLVNSGSQSDKRSVYAVHHELSSLFLKGYSFFINPWTDHNQKNFKYMSEIYKSHTEVHKASKAIKDYYELGIVTNYGLTSFENDFNEYSAMILTYPQKFKKIMDKYPRVRGKFLVWLDFYQEIDPIFTEEYLFGNG